MFRNTFADINMYFFLITLSLFYSVSSLTVVGFNSSTTVSPPALNQTTSAILQVTPPLLGEKIGVNSTERPSINFNETKNETGSVGQGTLFKLFNKQPVLGSTCFKNDDCKEQVNSVCLNGFCRCDTDFVATPNNKYCLRKAKSLEGDCLENIQCDSIHGESGLSICASFQCVCASNTVRISDKCYKKTVLGQSCKEDNDCISISNSYCYQGVCACDPDLIPDESGTQCFPYTNGTSNTTGIDCKASSLVCKVLGEHAYCSNDTCVCYPGYHLFNNLCVKEKSLGESCESNGECEVDMKPKEKPGARECKSRKCSCVKGFKGVTDHNICLSGSSISSASLLLIFSSLFFIMK